VQYGHGDDYALGLTQAQLRRPAPQEILITRQANARQCSLDRFEANCGRPRACECQAPSIAYRFEERIERVNGLCKTMLTCGHARPELSSLFKEDSRLEADLALNFAPFKGAPENRQSDRAFA